jgi:hypothetical protein
MIQSEVTEHIAVLSETGSGYTKELNMVSWNNAQPKYDIRVWRNTDTGKIMCKGITMTAEEMAALIEAMKGRI